MCKNKMEWMILDLANVLYGYTMVPIAETLDVVSLEAILELTKVKCLFVSNVAVKNLALVPNKHHLHTLVLIDPISSEQEKALKDKGYELLTYAHVMEQGK